MRLPAYGRRVGRERFQVSDRETRMVAGQVARVHAGKFRKDRARAEYAGPNEDTWKKYVHVINMWLDFVIMAGLYSARWSLLPLSEAMWVAVAAHFFHYSKGAVGLQCSTLEQYLRVLAHVLIFMNQLPVNMLGPLHKQQFTIIQRVVCSIGIVSIEQFQDLQEVSRTFMCYAWPCSCRVTSDNTDVPRMHNGNHVNRIDIQTTKQLHRSP